MLGSEEQRVKEENEKINERIAHKKQAIKENSTFNVKKDEAAYIESPEYQTITNGNVELEEKTKRAEKKAHTIRYVG